MNTSQKLLRLAGPWIVFSGILLVTTFHPQYEERDVQKKYPRIRKVAGKKVTVRDAKGQVEYVVSTEKLRDNVLQIGARFSRFPRFPGLSLRCTEHFWVYPERYLTIR